MVSRYPWVAWPNPAEDSNVDWRGGVSPPLRTTNAIPTDANIAVLTMPAAPDGVAGQVFATAQPVCVWTRGLVIPAIFVEIGGARLRDFAQIQRKMLELERHVADASIAGLRVKPFWAKRLARFGAAPAVERLPRIAFDVENTVQTMPFGIALERALVTQRLGAP